MFFKQRRHGFNNDEIEVYKFRSLYTDMTDHAVQKSVTKDDPRVTRVGRFIRKTSIDELPQLINVVFKGNLSLVGPRPHAVNQKIENRQFDEAVDGYFARHRVKPGITGWAQINGWRGELTEPREDQGPRRARPVLHRELVAAVRSRDPGRRRRSRCSSPRTRTEVGDVQTGTLSPRHPEVPAAGGPRRMSGPEIPGRRPFEAPPAFAGVAPQGDGDRLCRSMQAEASLFS